MKQKPISDLRERRYWIFDLDGTLTVAVHDFAAIRNELGVPHGSDILGYLAALPARDADALHKRLQQIELELAAVTVTAAGAQELLSRLRDNGSRMGILTRNTRENALRTLELIGLGSYFASGDILGREQALPKPDPDGIFRLMSRWGAPPSDAIMVGDYLYDLQAGRQAGALTVHVDTTGGFSWPEFTDLSVETLETLATWIAG
jgi:HAD superfamily hydrolase (TIGR01549 family)